MEGARTTNLQTKVIDKAKIILYRSDCGIYEN